MKQLTVMEAHTGKRHRVRKLKQATERLAQADAWMAGPGRQWREAESRLLEAVQPQQRPAVASLLRRLPEASLGLHAWLSALAWDNAFLPQPVPAPLLHVYLEHPEAVPGHECAHCGLALPARPLGGDAKEAGFFSHCPHCSTPAEEEQTETREEVEEAADAVRAG